MTLHRIETEMQKTETVEQVSAYIIKKLNIVSPLKLQKLLYYTCAFYYTLNDKHIHNNVPVEFQAWPHGPVNPYLYNMYKDEYHLHDSIEFKANMAGDKLNKNDTEFIDAVLALLGDKSGVFLETFSHTEEPWLEKRGGLPDYAPSRATISYDTIKTYYSTRISLS